MSRSRLTALLLALTALAVYLPVARHGFIIYDDGDYVTNNPMVENGLTWAGIKWAFTTFHSANWHPLTWLSHMTDCELFGLNPAGPHCVNALIHAANTVLVFFLWLQLTARAGASRREQASAHSAVTAFENPRSLWPAAFIAALFAVHPLHVESVAWIAERKDVLSAFFGLLSLLCYARYARDLAASTSSVPDRRSSLFRSPSSRFYWFALFFFACSLMSKPMLVTLPCLMLLLDYWPLRRFKEERESGATRDRISAMDSPAEAESRAGGTPGWVLMEKIPFFALTIASCIVTYIAQNRGAVKSLAAVPLGYRLENAPVALAMYLSKIFWPSRLAIIYPMPSFIPPVEFVISLAVLVLITVAVCWMRKSSPFLLVGWIWFAGTLVPVLGLVKVGDAAMADRYTYLPSIGIFMAVAFGARRIFAIMTSQPGRVGQQTTTTAEATLTGQPPKSPARIFIPAAAIIALAALTFVTERQLQFWRSNEALFKHAMDVTSRNVDAIINYGVALENKGQPLEAMEQYSRAAKLAPTSYMARADLGNLLYFTGQTNQALEQFEEAVKLKPDSARLHDRLGAILGALGRYARATNEFGQAVRFAPDNPSPHLHWGMTLAAAGNFAGATNQFSEALRLNPDDPAPLVEWSKTLLREDHDAEAMAKLQEALQLFPGNFQTLTFAARVLASDENPNIRNGAAALAFAQQADGLTDGKQPLVKDALGMAYAETGQYDKAQNAAREAIQLATNAGMPAGTINPMRERLRLYQDRQPWRQSFKN